MPTSQSPLYEDPRILAKRWYLLAVLCLSLVLVVMSVAGLNVALAEMQQALGATAGQLQWMVDSYTIIFGGLLLTAGAIGDRFGRRTALQGGLTIFALGSLMGAWATDSTVVILARAIMGFGAAFVMPATLSLISNIFPSGERTKAIAIWAGFAGAGGVLGPVLTGLFLTGWGVIPQAWWGIAFLYYLPIVVLTMIAVAIWMPQSKDSHATRLDPIGAGLSIVGLIALLFGIIEGAGQGWGEPAILAAFGIAVVTLVGFVWWESRNPTAMLPMKFFKDRRFSVGTSAIFITFFAMLGFFFLFPLYSQFVLGYTPLQAGLAMVPLSLAQLGISAPTAGLSARFGTGPVMLTGFVVLTVSFASWTMAGIDTSFWLMFLPLIGLGLGLGLAMTPATNDIMAAVPLDRAGVGSAVNDASREIGAALGIAVLGSVSAIAYRSHLDVSALPESIRAIASESVGGAHAAIAQLSEPAATAATNQVSIAFAGSFATAMAASAIAAVVGALVIIIWKPKHDLTQTEHQGSPAKLSEGHGGSSA